MILGCWDKPSASQFSALESVLTAARFDVSGGWCPFLCLDVQGIFCASNAEMVEKFSSFEALKKHSPDADVLMAAGELLGLVVNGDQYGFYFWEQTEGRKIGEIIAAFDRACTRAKALARERDV